MKISEELKTYTSTSPSAPYNWMWKGNMGVVEIVATPIVLFLLATKLHFIMYDPGKPDFSVAMPSVLFGFIFFVWLIYFMDTRINADTKLYFGAISIPLFPFVPWIYKIYRRKYIKSMFSIEDITDNTLLALDFLNQHNKLETLSCDLLIRKESTNNMLWQLDSIKKSGAFQNHPLIKSIESKLTDQCKEIDILIDSSKRQKSKIMERVDEMYIKVESIRSMQTLIQGTEMIDSNQVLIDEAKIVLKSYENHFRSIVGDVILLESEISSMNKSLSELPELYAKLQN